MSTSTFTITSKLWLYSGAAAWTFITLPQKESAQIKKAYSVLKRGWGSLPVAVKIGKTEWTTSIFPDTKSNAYLLPVKADVRQKEGLRVGDNITFRLRIRRPEFKSGL
jgi:hypothetical protein